jgi:hypothetical protein
VREPGERIAGLDLFQLSAEKHPRCCAPPLTTESVEILYLAAVRSTAGFFAELVSSSELNPRPDID